MKNAFEYEAELAALREKLDTANEHLNMWRDCSFDQTTQMNIELRQRLADAERRNAVCAELLDEVLSEVPHGWGESFSESELAERIRAALAKPEEAKPEEAKPEEAKPEEAKS